MLFASPLSQGVVAMLARTGPLSPRALFVSLALTGCAWSEVERGLERFGSPASLVGLFDG